MDNDKYYQMAQNVLERQLKTVDSMNTNVNTLLVVNGVLIVFLGDILLKNHWGPSFGLPFIIASLIYLLVSYRIIDWHQVPNIDRIVFDLEQGVVIDSFYREATKSIADIYIKNEKLLEKKTTRINRAVILLLLGVIASIIGSICLF